MQDFFIYGVNLFSEDCDYSSKLYHEYFSFEILNSSKNHSELRISKEVFLIFNNNSNECNVSSGSITLKTNQLNIEKLKSELSEFSLEMYSEKNHYASFLDLYKNRIWIYESQN